MATDDSADATRTLDVRETEGEPFGDIVAALAALPEDGTLELLNSFEPEPLYGVLSDRGFDHETEQVDDEWHIYVSHADES